MNYYYGDLKKFLKINSIENYEEIKASFLDKQSIITDTLTNFTNAASFKKELKQNYNDRNEGIYGNNN